jgi:hypothetical protein
MFGAFCERTDCLKFKMFPKTGHRLGSKGIATCAPSPLCLNIKPRSFEQFMEDVLERINRTVEKESCSITSSQPMAAIHPTQRLPRCGNIHLRVSVCSEESQIEGNALALCFSMSPGITFPAHYKQSDTRSENCRQY